MVCQVKIDHNLRHERNTHSSVARRLAKQSRKRGRENSKALIAGFAISIAALAWADIDVEWQSLTNAISASVDLNPTNRTDAQRIALYGKQRLMADVAALELVATNEEALMTCLDDIGTYISFPTNSYVVELANAKAEFLNWCVTNTLTRSEAFRRIGRYKYTGGNEFEQAVNVCWEPVLSRNKEIERYRHKVLATFKPAVQQHLSRMPQEMQATFRTNIMTRAALSEEEAEMLFGQ